MGSRSIYPFSVEFTDPECENVRVRLKRKGMYDMYDTNTYVENVEE